MHGAASCFGRNLRKIFHRTKKNVFAATKCTCNIELPGDALLGAAFN
jgi:hypothetical protein